jgi:hypothetical protein
MTLPTFVVVGAMRSGTSSLARWLRPHPEVFLALPKELHFFDEQYDRGTDWYRRRFADVDGERAVGEATPSYLYRGEAVERMAALLPDARLIAILRDPIERAYSHYWLERIRGREQRSFEDAVTAELGPHPVRETPGSMTYLAWGRYLPQLERLGRLYPRPAVLALLFDDLTASPTTTYAQVCRFLDVDDRFVPPTLGAAVNASIAFRSLAVRRLSKRLPAPARRVVDHFNVRPFRYPPVDPGLRKHLVDHMADDNRALATWLDRDLSAWMR